MSLLRGIVEFVLSVALAVATLAAFYGREWIERATGLAPDGGSGAAERGLVAVLCTAMVVEHRRALRPPTLARGNGLGRRYA